MTNFLSRLPQTQKRTMVILGALLLFVALVYVVVEHRLSNLAKTLTQQIVEQETLLAEIAKTTSNNGTDSYVENLVHDCAIEERTEFDRLLGTLDTGLPDPELTRLEQLFGRCGSFYAERKAVTVARLSREIEVYETYVLQLQTLKTLSLEKEYHVETWKELALAEKQQAELFMNLVTLQDKIIRALIEGKTPESLEIKTILTEVSETQGMLIVTNKQASDIRDVLKAP